MQTPVSPAPTPSDVFCSYVSALPKWLRHFGVPASDIACFMQIVWQSVCKGPLRLPNDIREARLGLLTVTRRAAVSLYVRYLFEAYRFVPELDDGGTDFDEVRIGRQPPVQLKVIDQEELFPFMLGIIEALERLSPEHQRLVRDHYVLGYTIKELAIRAGVSEKRMEKRVSRVSAKLEKLLQKNERWEGRNEKRESRALVTLFESNLDPVSRALFCSMCDPERKHNALGDGALPSSPSIPHVFPIARVLSETTALVIAAIGLVILIAMLVLGPRESDEQPDKLIHRELLHRVSW